MKSLYKKLAAYGLGGALALSGTFLVVPMEGEHKKKKWPVRSIHGFCRRLDMKAVKSKLIAAFIAAGLSAPAAFVAYGIGK